LKHFEERQFLLLNNIATINQNIVDLSRLNMEEIIREYGEEKEIRMMNIIIENGKWILELQKTLLMLEKKSKEKENKGR